MFSSYIYRYIFSDNPIIYLTALTFTMKLLAWMQHKLCLSSNQQRKNIDGDTSLVLHAQPTNRQLNQKHLKLKSKAEENWMEDALKDDPFHGFLAIGTLGSDPPTPTFPTPFQDITSEMELINSELEKFLSADAEEEISNELSSPRSSISFSNMQQNGADSDDFPLQKFTRKVLKKLLHSTDNATKSGATRRKLPKVPKIKLFPRQVHPDQEFVVGEPWINANEEEMDQSHVVRAETKEHSETIYRNGPAENTERWITTEDDYLVLELQSGNSQTTLARVL